MLFPFVFLLAHVSKSVSRTVTLRSPAAPRDTPPWIMRRPQASSFRLSLTPNTPSTPAPMPITA